MNQDHSLAPVSQTEPHIEGMEEKEGEKGKWEVENERVERMFTRNNKQHDIPEEKGILATNQGDPRKPASPAQSQAVEEKEEKMLKGKIDDGAKNKGEGEDRGGGEWGRRRGEDRGGGRDGIIEEEEQEEKIEGDEKGKIEEKIQKGKGKIAKIGEDKGKIEEEEEKMKTEEEKGKTEEEKGKTEEEKGKVEEEKGTTKEEEDDDDNQYLDGGWGWMVVLGGTMVSLLQSVLLTSQGLTFISLLEKFPHLQTTVVSGTMAIYNGCRFISGKLRFIIIHIKTNFFIFVHSVRINILQMN